MPADISVKICGLRTVDDVRAAADAGARYVGFVFFPKSPRHLEIADAAILAASVPMGVCKVALTVNADDALLDAITEAVPLDMLQLHGTESPERVAQVKARYGLPVMKAVGVADRSDLALCGWWLAVRSAPGCGWWQWTGHPSSRWNTPGPPA